MPSLKALTAAKIGLGHAVEWSAFRGKSKAKAWLSWGGREPLSNAFDSRGESPVAPDRNRQVSTSFGNGRPRFSGRLLRNRTLHFSQ